MKIWIFIPVMISMFQFAQAQIDQPVPGDRAGSYEKPSDPIHTITGINFFIENDFLHFLATNSDDNYTGGIHTRISTNLPVFNISVPFIPKDMLWQQFHNLGGGVITYTPEDLERSEIILDDRPYSSYQFFSYSVKSVSKDINTMIDLEISVGSMGKNIGGDMQVKIHDEEWFGSTRPVPEGWHNQIANGGAFAFNLHGTHRRYLMEWYRGEINLMDNLYSATNPFKPLYVASALDINVGNVVTNASAGLQFGLLNYNNFFGFSNSADLTAIAENRESLPWYKKLSFSLTVTPRIRYVLHNAHLTGRFLKTESVHVVNTEDLNRVFFEYDVRAMAGFTVLETFLINISYGLSGRGKEFTFQNKDFHHWGNLYLSINYRH